MGIVSSYDTRPDELKSGDVLVCTVTLHVGYRTDDEGKPMFRVYRCNYPPQVSSGIPQGSCLTSEGAEAMAEHLFPVVRWAGFKPE
jgi:hypothetical protein